MADLREPELRQEIPILRISSRSTTSATSKAEPIWWPSSSKASRVVSAASGCLLAGVLLNAVQAAVIATATTDT
jgi:hypothetical protein